VDYFGYEMDEPTMIPELTINRNKHMTIEQLIETIKQLESIAQQAIELAEEYSGGESETADQLRDALNECIEELHTIG
jgi:DNA-binding ferritin-like protein